MATKRTATPPPPPAAPARPPYMLIEEIRVQGYKSLVDATLHVRPLTLLAGTNSSGKSSIMQPLLLIKQTMEAPYQPAGALVLGGAHVKAETAVELVSKVDGVVDYKGLFLRVDGLTMNRYDNKIVKAHLSFSYKINGPNFIIDYQANSLHREPAKEIKLRPAMTWKEFSDGLDTKSKEIYSSAFHTGKVRQSNGFLEVVASGIDLEEVVLSSASHSVEASLSALMHIPGLRGLPQRSYVPTTFQYQAKGTFDTYAAGTVNQWQQQNNGSALTKLNSFLQRLGLTNAVTAKVKNANEIELSVNRLPAASKAKPRKADMVNIADVGIGVSQVLPILVALIAAQEGQLVYVEQPELHLHPKAQVEMAYLLADAAKRGVRVIVETHSSLLLLTVQTLVAEGELKPEEVGLHWFKRDAKGATTVTLAQVDENGAYGDWPEDFGDVELAAQSAYLNANTKRQPFKPTTYEG